MGRVELSRLRLQCSALEQPSNQDKIRRVMGPGARLGRDGSADWCVGGNSVPCRVSKASICVIRIWGQEARQDPLAEPPETPPLQGT